MALSVCEKLQKLFNNRVSVPSNVVSQSKTENKTMDKQQLVIALMHDESFDGRPYFDIVGDQTIAYGRNLDANPLTEDEGMFLLGNDINKVIAEVENFEWFHELNDVRQNVILNMVYNLGLTRFLGFRRMIDALIKGDYALAAVEMQDSKWFRQVGGRAERLCIEMTTGKVSTFL